MIILEAEGIKLISVNDKFMIARGRMILTSKYRSCKQEIFWRTIKPPKFDKSKSYLINIWMHGYIDIDNHNKVVIDGVCQRLDYNDRDLLELHVYKVKRKRGKLAYLRVEIEQMGE